MTGRGPRYGFADPVTRRIVAVGNGGPVAFFYGLDLAVQRILRMPAVLSYQIAGGVVVVIVTPLAGIIAVVVVFDNDWSLAPKVYYVRTPVAINRTAPADHHHGF